MMMMTFRAHSIFLSIFDDSERISALFLAQKRVQKVGRTGKRMFSTALKAATNASSLWFG
jgi:hypothetical protein